MTEDCGFVYLMQNELGRTKIGITETSPKERMEKLNYEMKKVGTFAECKFHSYLPNYRFHEKDLHVKFKDRHVTGEWFDLTAEKIASLTPFLNWQKGDGGAYNLCVSESSDRFYLKLHPAIYARVKNDCATRGISTWQLLEQILEKHYMDDTGID